MHYYQFNIADYRKDTMHLTRLEDSIYRQLIDSYYLTEKPIPLDDAYAMRLHSICNAEEMQAYANVLQDFFLCTEQGYVHPRIERDIEQYHAKSEARRQAANARWKPAKSKSNANAYQKQSKSNANHKPITNNHNKENIKRKFTPPQLAVVQQYCKERGNNVDAEQWHDFYSSKDWMVGKNKMKDWKASVRTWERNSNNDKSKDEWSGNTL